MSEVTTLDLADLPVLQKLYATYSANLFSADQLRFGIFYGMRVGDTIVAAGGTHAISDRYGIAAIGSIYTRPEVRGKGYATAISSAIITELFQGRCSEVILNVAEANETARPLYQQLGFRQHGQYWEGRARRRETGRSLARRWKVK
jgi:predicted GNAT family acetyltransferase